VAISGALWVAAGEASPTPSRRRGCAAHAGESWRFLGGTRFSLCGRVELLRRMGGVTTANGWSYYGTAGWSYYGKKAGNVTTAKDPTSAVLVGLCRRQALALLKAWQIPTTAPKPPREARPIPGRSWVIFLRGVWVFGCLGVWVFGCLAVWLFTCKASPTPKRRRGCAAHVGETLGESWMECVFHSAGRERYAVVLGMICRGL